MVNFILRLLGLGKAVDALDGGTSKAYLGGLGMILSGGATLLGGIAKIVMAIVPLHGIGQYIEFAQSLPNDPNAALVLAGVALISKGIADIGQRHAVAKIAQPAPTPALPEAQ